MKNNLFDFATSELSQDAVICYLINCFNGDNQELKEMSTNIIADLTGLAREEIKTVKMPKRQLSRKVKVTENEVINGIKKSVEKEIVVKIDVLVIVNYGMDNCRAIIIEDKTYTTAHNDQIERYKIGLQELDEEIDGVKFETITDDQIKTVYWKTGFWFDYDTAVYANKKVNREDIKKYISNYKNENEIIQDYYDYLRSLDDKEERARVFWEDSRLKESSISQHIFLRKIFPEKLWKLEWNQKYENYNGSSYGRPWTEMGIAYLGCEENKNKQSIFWRVDSFKKKRGGESAPCLALRVYAEKHYDDNNKVIAWKKDTEGQNNHKKIYEYLYDSVKSKLENVNCPIELIFKNPNSGDRESTLFYLFPSKEDLKAIYEGKEETINAICEINEVALKVINKYSNQHSLEK